MMTEIVVGLFVGAAVWQAGGGSVFAVAAAIAIICGALYVERVQGLR